MRGEDDDDEKDGMEMDEEDEEEEGGDLKRRRGSSPDTYDEVGPPTANFNEREALQGLLGISTSLPDDTSSPSPPSSSSIPYWRAKSKESALAAFSTPFCD